MTTEMEAFASLREAFPEMTLIEVIKEKLMTDVIDATAANADQDWSDVEGSASFPEVPANPHNHLFTLSLVPDKAPFLVIRANTARDLVQTMESLEQDGVYAAMGKAQTTFRTQSQAAPPAAAGAPQFQAMAQQTFTQQPAQQFPGVTGQAPAQWQNAGAPAFTPAPPAGPQVPQGWYRLNVPFPQKNAFDAIVAQHGFKKADPNYGGQVSFQKTPIKAWYCAPEVAGAFAQFSPVDAHS